MKELMKTNIYDVGNTILIIGSCLKNVEPNAYKKLETMTNYIYELCLEETHINMAITKIGGMIGTGKIKKIIFATVDRSPHCIQMHYIKHELKRMMNLDNILITDYIAKDGELIEINEKTIELSKTLSILEIKNESGEL